jgi:hypothetical protein
MASIDPFTSSIPDFERRAARAAGFTDPDWVLPTHEAPPVMPTNLVTVLLGLDEDDANNRVPSNTNGSSAASASPDDRQA